MPEAASFEYRNCPPSQRAQAHGDKKLADLFERRFLPEFRPAFEAWKKTDSLNNPKAPAGPQLMAEYRSSKTDEAARLNDQATEVFERGIQGRQHSDGERSGHAEMNSPCRSE